MTNHRDLGAIEGRLLMVSLRRTMHVGVWDAATDRAIICYFDSDDLFEEARSALGKRVSAYGVVRYSKVGEAVSIDVERIRVLGEDAELPSVDDVHGILSRTE